MSEKEYKYISYHKQKSDEWLDIITKCKAECSASNLTVDEWCAVHNVNPKNYWRWHKVLKDECLLNINNGLEKDISVLNNSVPELYTVPSPKVTASTSDAVATIRTSNVSVDIYSNDANLIVAVLRGIASC